MKIKYIILSALVLNMQGLLKRAFEWTYNMPRQDMPPTERLQKALDHTSSADTSGILLQAIADGADINKITFNNPLCYADLNDFLVNFSRYFYARGPQNAFPIALKQLVPNMDASQLTCNLISCCRESAKTQNVQEHAFILELAKILIDAGATVDASLVALVPQEQELHRFLQQNCVAGTAQL